jgi:hypothetical protein
MIQDWFDVAVQFMVPPLAFVMARGCPAGLLVVVPMKGKLVGATERTAGGETPRVIFTTWLDGFAPGALNVTVPV